MYPDWYCNGIGRYTSNCVFQHNVDQYGSNFVIFYVVGLLLFLALAAIAVWMRK